MMRVIGDFVYLCVAISGFAGFRLFFHEIV